VSEEKRVADDLLFLLTYMASIATADIDRNELFKHTSEQNYPLSIYFKRVYTLAAKWSYAYSKACKFISKKAKFVILGTIENSSEITISLNFYRRARGERRGIRKPSED